MMVDLPPPDGPTYQHVKNSQEHFKNVRKCLSYFAHNNSLMPKLYISLEAEAYLNPCQASKYLQKIYRNLRCFTNTPPSRDRKIH